MNKVVNFLAKVKWMNVMLAVLVIYTLINCIVPSVKLASVEIMDKCYAQGYSTCGDIADTVSQYLTHAPKQ